MIRSASLVKYSYWRRKRTGLKFGKRGRSREGRGGSRKEGSVEGVMGRGIMGEGVE